MKRLSILALALSTFLLVSCGQPASTTGAGFGLVFRYGVAGVVGPRNVLDTTRGTFTKDMVVDPPVTTRLRLTEEDLARIMARVDEMDFWEYPEVLEPERPKYSVTPYASYYFEVRKGSVIKEVRWEDQYGDEGARAVRLRDLAEFIREIVESKPEYKALPEPKGGYL